MKSLARLSLGLAGAVLLSLPALAQTKWNLPAAYPADNFHTENLVAVLQGRRGRDRRQAADRRPRQRLPVQGAGDQARGADRPGADRRGADVAARERGPALRPRRGAVPRRPRSTRPTSSGRLQKPALEKKLASQGLMLLYTVAWPPQGIYAKKDLTTIDDMKGLKWRSYNVGTSRIAELVGRAGRHHPGGGTAAGARHRRRQFLHVVRRDGLRFEGLGIADAFLRHAGLGAEEHDLRQQGGVRRARQADPGCGAQARPRPPRTRGWKIAQEKTKWYTDQLAAKGMKVLPPSPELKAGFRRSASSSPPIGSRRPAPTDRRSSTPTGRPGRRKLNQRFPAVCRHGRTWSGHPRFGVE